MGKTKCKDKREKNKDKVLKPSHRFECGKCGRSAKKKTRLCKANKIGADY